MASVLRLVLVITCLACAGCAGVVRKDASTLDLPAPAPTEAITVVDANGHRTTYLSQAAVDLSLCQTQHEGDEVGRAQCLYGLIERRLMLIDKHYGELVSDLRHSKTQMDLFTKLSTLALGVAGTLSDSAGAKTNYAAATTLINGGSVAIDQAALYEQSIAALISAMDAARSEVRLSMRLRMRNGYAAYPIADIHFDLLTYERAGTLQGGLTFIQTTAQTTAAANAEREIYPLTPDQQKVARCISEALVAARKADKLPGLVAVAADLKLSLTEEEKGDVIKAQKRIVDYWRNSTTADMKAIDAALAKARLLAASCSGS